MQEETQEYLEEAKLKELVGKYSEFINFPIYLYASKEVDIPADEADVTEADESEVTDEGEEDTEVEDEGAACSCSAVCLGLLLLAQSAVFPAMLWVFLSCVTMAVSVA